MSLSIPWHGDGGSVIPTIHGSDEAWRSSPMASRSLDRQLDRLAHGDAGEIVEPLSSVPGLALGHSEWMPRRVAFVYPGLGNHFKGMGRELSTLWPEILRRQESENRYLRDQLRRGLVGRAAPDLHGSPSPYSRPGLGRQPRHRYPAEPGGEPRRRDRLQHGRIVGPRLVESLARSAMRSSSDCESLHYSNPSLPVHFMPPAESGESRRQIPSSG